MVAQTPAAHADPPTSAIENQWELFGQTHLGLVATTALPVHRGVLPGGTSKLAPAPSATFSVVAKVGAGTGGWDIGLRDGNGVWMAAIAIGAATSGFQTFSATFSWSSFDRTLKDIYVQALPGNTRVIDIKKAYLKLKQSGTITKTVARTPIAIRQDAVASVSWTDVADPIFYRHDAGAFDPSPSVALRTSGRASHSCARLEGRLIDDLGTPVGTWVTRNDGTAWSSDQTGVSLANGRTYRMQIRKQPSTCLGLPVVADLLSADLVFEQTTSDPNGIAKTMGFYPGVSAATEASMAGAALEFPFAAPDNSVAAEIASFDVSMKRISGSGNAGVKLIDQGTGAALATVTTVSGSYVYLDTPVSSLPGSSVTLDTATVTASGTTGRISQTVLRAVLILRNAVTGLAASNPAFSPNDDAIKETTTITATIDASIPSPSWTLMISNAEGLDVRAFSGTGASISAIWDGTSEVGTELDDGLYTATLTLDDHPDAIAAIEIVLDTAAPGIAAVAPADDGNTMFTSQPIVAALSDQALLEDESTVAGSGVDAASLLVVVDDLTGSRPDQTPTATLIDGVLLRTAAVTLDRGSTFEVSVTAADLAGNISTRTSTFDVMQTATATIPTAGIASTVADSVVVGGGVGGSDLYRWDAPPVNLGAYTVSLNATRHTGYGAVDIDFALASAQVSYTINGVPGTASVDQTTGQLTDVFQAAQTGIVSIPVATHQTAAASLTASVPSGADAGSVTLSMPTITATSAELALCADPTIGSSMCSPDPVTANPREDIWRPWANLADVDPFELSQAVAPLVDLTLQPSDPVCIGTQAPPSLATAIQDLGIAMGSADALDPSISLDPTLSTALARLVDCTATYVSKLVSAGAPELDATQALWLEGQRDLLSAIQDLIPIVNATPVGCEVLDDRAWIELCDNQAQNHTADRLILIDQGGNDSYHNNAGGANDLDANGNPAIPVAIALDIAGDDDYYDDTPVCNPVCGFGDGPRIGASFGNAIGILVDNAGGDKYGLGVGKEHSQGFAVGGSGYLLDLGGSDTYNANGGRAIGYSASQGFGFVIDKLDGSETTPNIFRAYFGNGIGVVEEAAGQDANGIPQGRSVGMVIGSAGSDRYRAICPEGSLCETSNNVYTRRAIGSVTTARYGGGPGVGIVIDPAGSDVYRCQKATSCLGASVSDGAGLGAVLDLGPESDTYTINEPSVRTLSYAEGGMAVVVDEGGADTYDCFSENCLGVARLRADDAFLWPADAIFVDQADIGGDTTCYLHSTHLPAFSTFQAPWGPARGGSNTLWAGEVGAADTTLLGTGVNLGTQLAGSNQTSTKRCVR